jgi:hypothetical protein
MKLTAIEPGGAGQDLRFFTCSHCRRVQRHLIDSTVTEAWLEPQRDECIAQASICREKAQGDPARYDYWIDQAVVLLQHAIQARRGKAVSYDVRDGLAGYSHADRLGAARRRS